MEKNLSNLKQSQKQFVNDAYNRFGRDIVTHADHATMLQEGLIDKKQGWFFGNSTYRVSSGKFQLPLSKVFVGIDDSDEVWNENDVSEDIDSVDKEVTIQEVTIPVAPKSLEREIDYTFNFIKVGIFFYKANFY